MKKNGYVRSMPDNPTNKVNENKEARVRPEHARQPSQTEFSRRKKKEWVRPEHARQPNPNKTKNKLKNRS